MQVYDLNKYLTKDLCQLKFEKLCPQIYNLLYQPDQAHTILLFHMYHRSSIATS